MIHDLDTLRTLLDELSRLDFTVRDLTPQQAAGLAESFRDCRLEIIRLGHVRLSDEQLHRLEQMDYRLQMVVTGHGLADGVAPEARRVLESFGWTTNT